jgi:hypothetical protein
VKDEVRCEELGRIQVRGIGHPVATYRVVDLHVAGRSGSLRSELPHLKLDVDPELMSADERGQAAALLQEALRRLDVRSVAPQEPPAATSTRPAPPSGRRQRIRSA